MDFKDFDRDSDFKVGHRVFYVAVDGPLNGKINAEVIEGNVDLVRVGGYDVKNREDGSIRYVKNNDIYRYRVPALCGLTERLRKLRTALNAEIDGILNTTVDKILNGLSDTDTKSVVIWLATLTKG